MTPEENALATLRDIVDFIRWKATDDPFLADAVQHLQSDLVELDERPYEPPRAPSEPWWDCYFEEDWDLWRECDGSFPCQENCDADWAGCQWFDFSSEDILRIWHFKFWDELYTLHTPQMNLFSEESRSIKVTMLTAEALLEAINLLVVREITEL